MLVSMALQDIKRGLGVILLDATGKSATSLMEHIEPELLDKVVFVDPANAEYPYSWNIFDDIKTLPASERTDMLVEVLSEVYQLTPSPFLKEVALVLLSREGTTLITFYSLITDQKFREKFFAEDEVTQKKFTDKLTANADMIETLKESGKFIVQDTMVRNVVGQANSKFTLDHLPDGQIVVVDFSHIRIYPTRVTPLMKLFTLGARIANRKNNTPVGLYLHDTLRYLTEGEIDRTFSAPTALSVTVADTLIQEADTDKRLSALSRCGSVASFAAHSADKEIIEKAFYPFAELNDLVQLEPGEFIVLLTIDGTRGKPFFARTRTLPEKKNVSYQDMVVHACRNYTTVRSKVDESFKDKKSEVSDQKKQSGNFQDAFRSIFAKQAERAKQAEEDPEAKNKDADKNKNKDDDSTPKRPSKNNGDAQSTSEQPQHKETPPQKKEIPERSLRELLYVAPIALLLTLSFPLISFASVSFTEVMYDLEGADAGREWVEVYNAGNETLDLSTWKLFEANTNHALTLVSGGALPPSGYAVIADNSTKFLVDWPNFNGVLYDSAFSLSNSGEALTIRDQSLTDVDTTLYQPELGADGNGMSLQKISSGAWAPASPTPGSPSGAQPTSQTPPVSSQTEQQNQHTENTTGNSQPSSFINPDIFTDAGKDRTVFVGADSVFSAQTIGLTGAPLQGARHVWTFGNGDRKEGQKVLYNFSFPGTYTVVVNTSSGAHSATDRIVVQAIPASLVISEVTSEYIAIENKSDVEVDLGGWMLFSSGTQFQFPSYTIVSAGQEVLVSNKRTGLSGLAPHTVALQYPNGLVAVAYESPLFVARPPRPARGATASVGVGATTATISQGPLGTVPQIPNSSAGDAPLSSKIFGQEGALITAPSVALAESSSRIPPLLGWFVALFAVVGIAVASVVFLRGNGYKEYSIKEIE